MTTSGRLYNVDGKLFPALALVLLLTVAFAPARGQRVLFVGNSYTEVNNLPQMVQRIAGSAGCQMEYQAVTPGGCNFAQHCNGQAMQLICQGGWDVVVLQEQSQLPSFPQGQVENEVFPYAKRLVDSIYSNNPCAEPMFYMTWGRRDGDQQNAPFFPVLGTYEGMDSMLCLRYMQMAEDNDAAVCPVGRVWRRLRQQHPDIELYASDGSHPSLTGTYAAACTFYSLIFGGDAREVTFDAGLDAQVAQVVRETVHEVVDADGAEWRFNLPSATPEVAGYDDGGSTVLLTAADVHADSLLWSFGDGTPDTMVLADAGTVISHTYASPGTYTVELSSMLHCRQTDKSIDVVVLSNGVGEDVLEALFAVWPNPARGSVQLSVPQGGEVTLRTVDGRVLSSLCVEAGETRMLLDGIAPGCYVLHFECDGMASTRRLVIL